MMQKRKLRRIELVPATALATQTTSYLEELCRLFQIDPDTDFHKTKKLKVWYRPCHKQLYMF